jgi:DNA-binding transcriptional LysR family regulator
MVDVRQLRYFAAVAEELHFGRAAKRLNISQPPLSMQVRALEKELGVQLLERTSQRVELTAAGRTVLRDVYLLLEQLEQLKANARRASTEATVKLRIGVIATLLDGVLPDVMKAFTRHHPEIELTLHEADSDEGIALVERGELDAALVRPDRVGKFQMIQVSEDHFVAAVPKSHALAKAREIRLASLKGERLIVHRQRRLPNLYESIIRACREAGFTPDLSIQSPTARSQLAAVRAGQGVALVPSFMQATPVPDIVFLPLRPQIPLTGIALMWMTSTPRWHLDQLAAMIGSRLGERGGFRKKPGSAPRPAKRRTRSASS